MLLSVNPVTQTFGRLEDTMDNVLNLDSTILTDIKDDLGLNSEDTSFDTVLVSYISMALSQIDQVSDSTKISISKTTKWSECFTELQKTGSIFMNMVRHYVFVATYLLFDPPASSTLKVLKDSQSEIIWRIEAEQRILERGEITSE